MLPKSKNISNEETIDLIKQYQGNADVEIRNKILVGNLGLIYSLAHKYRVVSYHQTFDDFVSEGILGMMDAIDHFDLKRENQFSTYAYWRILKRINDAVSLGTLGIPQHRINIYRAYEKIRSEIMNMGGSIDIESIASTMNVSSKILIDTINQKDEVSLDHPNVSTGRMTSGVNFEDALIDMIDFEKTKDIIKSVLSEREELVLNHRFGLNGCEELTLKDISKKLNVSTECVRIVQNKSLKKIKKETNKRAMSKR